MRLSFDGIRQFAWDNTSLDLFRTCPRKYYYSMVLGKTSPRSNVDLIFGTLIHQTLEHFDKLVATGTPRDEALHKTVRLALELSGERQNGAWVPWESYDSKKNRRNLIRSIIWYVEHYAEDGLETLILPDGRPAVELSFRFELPELDGYFYCGHIDRIVLWNDKPHVLDRKTTRSTLSTHYFDNFSPDGQMSGYSLAASLFIEDAAAGVIIDGIEVAVGFSRFARGIAPRSPEILNEFLANTVFWIKLAAACAEADNWPMNESGCSKYGGCLYREVCRQPETRRELTLAQYADRKWDPLETR